MSRQPWRRHAAVPISIGLVGVLGLLGLWQGHQAGAQAETTHRSDGLSLQRTLAGLTGEYAQVGAGEMLDIVAAQERAGAAAWTGTPGNRADALRLHQVAGGSRSLAAGALLVVAPGVVTASFVPEGHLLPARTDQGWTPLRAAATGGGKVVPVSGVLHGGGVPLVAIAVPVPLRSGATALLVGLSELRT